jgi:hypothetical protein
MKTSKRTQVEPQTERQVEEHEHGTMPAAAVLADIHASDLPGRGRTLCGTPLDATLRLGADHDLTCPACCRIAGEDRARVGLWTMENHRQAVGR